MGIIIFLLPSVLEEAKTRNLGNIEVDSDSSAGEYSCLNQLKSLREKLLSYENPDSSALIIFPPQLGARGRGGKRASNGEEDDPARRKQLMDLKRV